MSEQAIVDFAMQCGATWAGAEKMALHETRRGVSIFFPSEHDAIEFCYNVRGWLKDNLYRGCQVTREQEFVLIWL